MVNVRYQQSRGDDTLFFKICISNKIVILILYVEKIIKIRDNHARTKHIDTRLCEKGMISFIFFKTNDQLLYIFTKSLGGTKFEKIYMIFALKL